MVVHGKVLNTQISRFLLLTVVFVLMRHRWFKDSELITYQPIAMRF